MAERCLDMVWFLIGTVSIAATVLFLVPAFFRLAPTVVMSGSMEPEISVGSVVYIEKDIPPEDIGEQDIISYRRGEKISVLHRVVGVNRKNRTFCTKGDANQSADPGTVEYSQYEGKAVFSIPYLGYVVWLLQSGQNVIWILSGAMLLTGAEWYRRSAGKRRAV